MDVCINLLAWGELENEIPSQNSPYFSLSNFQHILSKIFKYFCNQFQSAAMKGNKGISKNFHEQPYTFHILYFMH